MTATPASRSRTELLWLAAIVGLVIVLRVWSLGADPMPELDPGFISDSGTWWKNARLHALYGVWTVDDGNYAIMTGPAYTLVLRAVFGLLGVGYAQGYAASVLSGVLTVILIYAMVRREASARAALLAAAFAGIDLMTIVYSRSAYPESFQLMMMTVVVAAIVTSTGRAWLAALGGVGAAIVVLSKPPGIVLAPIATATWAAHWRTNRAAGQPRPLDRRGILAYAAAVGATLIVVGLVYLRPHADDVWLHLQQQMADAAALGARATDRVLLFGSRLGYRRNEFFTNEWYLLILAAALGAARLARVLRRPLTTIEVACWLWLLMGLGAMGLQTYQQDRRFLFLVPPLAIMSALLLAEPVELGESAWQGRRARRIAVGAAAGLLALVVLFYAVPLGVWKMMTLGRLLGRTWDYGLAGGLLLSAGLVAAALVAAWRTPQPRWRGRLAPQLALGVILLVLVLARAGPELLNRSHGLETVSRLLDRISAGWPEGDRYAVGWSAGTLTLATRLIPVNHELKGPKAVERFHPQLELYAAPTGRPVNRHEYWAVPGQPSKLDCAQVPIWNDAQGRSRITVHIFVEPNRLAACQDSARVSTSGPH